jgi:hypothetical protein
MGFSYGVTSKVLHMSHHYHLTWMTFSIKFVNPQNHLIKNNVKFWKRFVYGTDVVRITNGAHIEHTCSSKKKKKKGGEWERRSWRRS